MNCSSETTNIKFYANHVIHLFPDHYRILILYPLHDKLTQNTARWLCDGCQI